MESKQPEGRAGEPALSRELTRRRMLLGLGAGVAGAAVAPILAACGGASPTATPAGAAPTATRAAGGTTTPATGGAVTATTGGGASPAARPPGSPGASPAGGAATPAVAYTPPAISGGGHTLKLLLWSHFVPAFDEYLDKYAKDWGAKNNVQVTVDHVPTDTVVTRAAAEVAANSGHDMVQFETGPDVQVYADKAVDVSKLANYLGSQYGGWL